MRGWIGEKCHGFVLRWQRERQIDPAGPARHISRMMETADTICRVVGAWVALEVFTPQVARPSWGVLAAERGGRQRNKSTAVADGPAYWEVPGDGDPTPWPQRSDPLPEPDGGSDTLRRRYVAVLGALPAKPA